MNKAFKCPGCDTSTWGYLKFCPKCGTALDVTCEECGHSVRYFKAENLNFCPKCGGKMNSKAKAQTPGRKEK
jgi:rRNA maturation endonuclease Nob1